MSWAICNQPILPSDTSHLSPLPAPTSSPAHAELLPLRSVVVQSACRTIVLVKTYTLISQPIQRRCIQPFLSITAQIVRNNHQNIWLHLILQMSKTSLTLSPKILSHSSPPLKTSSQPLCQAKTFAIIQKACHQNSSRQKYLRHNNYFIFLNSNISSVGGI